MHLTTCLYMIVILSLTESLDSDFTDSIQETTTMALFRRWPGGEAKMYCPSFSDWSGDMLFRECSHLLSI